MTSGCALHHIALHYILCHAHPVQSRIQNVQCIKITSLVLRCLAMKLVLGYQLRNPMIHMLYYIIYHCLFLHFFIFDPKSFPPLIVFIKLTVSVYLIWLCVEIIIWWYNHMILLLCREHWNITRTRTLIIQKLKRR